MFCATEELNGNEEGLEVLTAAQTPLTVEEEKVEPLSLTSETKDEAMDNELSTTKEASVKVKKKIVWTPESIEASKRSLFEKVHQKIEIVKEAHETKNYSDMKYRNAFHYLGNCYFGLKQAPLAERVKMRLEVVEIFRQQNIVQTIVNIFADLVNEGLPTQFLDPDGNLIERLVRPTRTTLAIAFNFSDASTEFCKDLMKTNKLIEVIFEILSQLRHPHFEETLNPDVVKLLRICIAVIYNIVMHDELDYVDEMHDVGLVSAVQPYLNSPNSNVRATALLFTIYVVNEEEASKFCTNESSLKFVIKNLKIAVNDKYKRGNGYSNHELLKVLGKLSALDIKKKLADVGALELMKSLLETGDEDEVKSSVKILWQLAFDTDNAEWIKESKTLELVEDLVEKSESKDFVRAAQGLIWVVEEKTDFCLRKDFQRGSERHVPHSSQRDSKVNGRPGDHADPGDGASSVPPPPPPPSYYHNHHHHPSPPPPPCPPSKFLLKSDPMTGGSSVPLTPPPPELSSSTRRTDFERGQTTDSYKTQDSSSEKHIMISYDWSCQKRIIELKNFISSNGYRVWLDLDDMGDNTLDGMAYAVENAWIVLVCVSRKYKESQNCRLEAEYAFRLRKSVIPLMLDRYRPDGWLGFLIGAKLYYDFSGKYPFSEKCQELLRAINKIIGGDVSTDLADGAATNLPVVETPTIQETVKGETSSMFESPRPSKRDLRYLDGWDKERIMKWCRENEIEWSGMLSITGHELRFLARVQSESPDFFYRCLETKLQLRSLREMARFVDAMDKL